MDNGQYLGQCLGIIGWIGLGLIAGFVASKVVAKTGEGVVLDILLGVVGALVGGFLFNTLGALGATGFSLFSMVDAVAGAAAVLLIDHMIAGRRVAATTKAR